MSTRTVYVLSGRFDTSTGEQGLYDPKVFAKREDAERTMRANAEEYVKRNWEYVASEPGTPFDEMISNCEEYKVDSFTAKVFMDNEGTWSKWMIDEVTVVE